MECATPRGLWAAPMSGFAAHRFTFAAIAFLASVSAVHGRPHRPGPVPDFAPIRFVTTHSELDSVQPDLAEALDASLGERHLIERWAPLRAVDDEHPDEFDDSLLWMRDYQPIFARRQDGKLVAVRYLAWNPNRSTYRPQHLGHPPERDFIWAHDGPLPDPVPIVPLPLVHEQGNLVTTGRLIFVSRQFVEDNGIDWEQRHLTASGYHPRPPDEVITLLAKTLGRPPADVVVLDHLPAEATGHVDLFLMPIDADTVMVPEITEDGIDAARDAGEHAIALLAREFLDRVAEQLRARRLIVPRLPMLPPRIVSIDDSVGEDGGDWGVTYMSPANGLLVRDRTAADVYLPVFTRTKLRRDVAALQARYIRKWKRFFVRHGWTPHVVPADRLAGLLGLLRCVTAVTPY